MRDRTLLIVGAGLVIAGALGLAAAASYALVAGGSGSDGRADGIDAVFIREMVPHHEDAIAMAEAALTRAEHPEVRDLAKDIRRSQSEENESMREWYRDWFGRDVPPASGIRGRMHGGMDVEDLENAKDFDKAFIEAMIPHHQQAIMMASMMAASSGRTEMRELADSIIETQSREIEQMSAWYEEWYGR